MSAATAIPIASELLRRGRKEASGLSVETFGYDFVGLGTKIVIFFVLAVAFKGIHDMINGVGNVASVIAGLLGFKLPPPSAEPSFMRKLFSEEGIHGVSYWQIVNFVLIALVVAEMLRYSSAVKQTGGTSSPFTLAVFAGIILLLASFTIPQLIQKLRMTNNNLGEFR